MKNPIVYLRVYHSNGRDQKVNYSKDGEVQNENILVSLEYNTLAWSNYLKYIKAMGFVKVIVEKINGEGNMAEIKKEVYNAFNNISKKPLTDDQKRIAELEAKINSLAGKSNEKDTDVKGEKEAFTDRGGNFQSDDLAEVKAEYQKVFGKKPFHKWDIDQLKDKIKNK